MTSDRRHTERLPTQLGGTVVVGDVSHTCSIDNLSVIGALLVGAPAVEVGQEVIVIMALPGSEPFPIWAVVVRVDATDPPQLGVTFRPSHRAQRRLERFVEAALAAERLADGAEPIAE